MPDYLLYIAEIGISLFLFYSVFWIFLKSETYFTINRYYIAGTIFLSLLIPLINIPIARNTTEIVYYNMISTVVITADGFENAMRHQLQTTEMVWYIYLAGVSLFTLRFLFQVSSIIILLLKSEIKKHGTLKYVLIDHNYTPFSFFNYIFLSKKLESKELKKILLHESIHARQYHSLDIIVMELMTIIQWFNPFIWFYKYSMQEVHEYLADQGVLKKGHDPKEYQGLIFEQLFGFQNFRLASSFNYSITKRRFIMMSKIKSPKSAMLRVLLLIPVLTLVVLAFSCSNEELSRDDVVQIEDAAEKVYEKVEVMPTYPGGNEGLVEYLMSTIKYPEVAKKLGVGGKVFVAFVIDKDGKVIDVEIVKGIADEFSKEILDGHEISAYEAAQFIEEEAKRVVRQMPDWNPGKHGGKHVKVKFTLPINFQLDNEKK